MPPLAMTICANISPIKRTFDEIIFPSPGCSSPLQAHYAIDPQNDSVRHQYLSPYSPSKRRLSFPRSPIMLAEHSTIMSGSFPSFMSVFGSEESEIYRPVNLGQNQVKSDHDAFMLMTQPISNAQVSQQHPRSHHHRGSINSLFSDSTESSPTTTNSTFDSPLVSANTSASSSPESATSLAPTTSFRSSTSTEDQQFTSQEDIKDSTPVPQQPQIMQDATRNVKKLTLDVNHATAPRPSTAPGLDFHPLSAPSSPLKEPLKSARKKPNNLTIRTPGYNQLTFPRAGIVPPTPSNRPLLHHHPSSPALLSLASPRGPPAGGMFLPLPSLNTQQSKHNSLSSSNGSSFLANSMPDLREESDIPVPKSQEAPERGYTEGPVCIYDTGVYLYLEPTAEEARNFDLVINVAKEIRNPFKAQTSAEGTVMSVWRAETKNNPRNSIAEPQTAVSEYSFKSAWEWPQSENTITPNITTPTQTSFGSKPQEPEYVHVRWDHNSEILEDLYPLCKLIDDRVAEHKKVLVHCQLGVSRSASLIIAYGLFKNYQANFHAMYTTVKERSRWVGPNMSLIYQLTDFKGKLNRGEYASGAKGLNPEWFVKSPSGPLTPTTTDPAPPSIAETTAPKPDNSISSNGPVEQKRITPLRLNKALPPVPLFPKDEKRSETPTQTPTIPGAFPPPTPQKIPIATTTVKRAASRPLPFRERNMDMTIPDHRPRDRPGIAVIRSSAIMDLAMKDVPSTPSLFSPRAAEFMASPFGIRGAGDLETPGNRMSKEIPSGFNWLPLRKEAQTQGHSRTASKDPRSPHQQAEAAEVWRSIDDIL